MKKGYFFFCLELGMLYLAQLTIAPLFYPSANLRAAKV